MSWTDERVETLKELWAEGKSASQIAKEMGGVTRNAVIGKVHRLGLSNRAKAAAAAAEEPKAAAKPAENAGAKAKTTPASKSTEPASAEKTSKKAPEKAETASARPDATPAAAETAPSAEKEAEKQAAEKPAEEKQAAPVPAPLAERQRPVIRDATQPRAPGAPTPEEIAARATLIEIEKFVKRISLLELTERVCKWPIGDPTDEDFAFCGLEAVPGKPYCAHHIAIAFQPMSSRRDRSRSRASR
ncbi:MAG TPA: GcrA family cell cycle regulator [Paracoccaceae bacterium]|nr:GcrA family cell cycle regulator [Paracoccaceae bacterium]